MVGKNLPFYIKLVINYTQLYQTMKQTKQNYRLIYL